jgi:hypothetical protein
MYVNIQLYIICIDRKFFDSINYTIYYKNSIKTIRNLCLCDFDKLCYP